jgi:hypothetical protein
MSEAVKPEGMLLSIDLDIELSREGGGIMQEIGEECAGEVWERGEGIY